MQSIRNHDATGAWIGGLIGLVGMAMVLAPSLIGMDMMSAGFGIAFIGFFVVIVGLVTAIVFGQRARQMNRILADENILARWTYDEAQIRQQVEEEFGRQKSANRATFTIMLFFFVVIGLGFMGFSVLDEGEINWGFAGFFFGILALLAVVAYITPILSRRGALRASREVIIARNGVVLNGALHTWVAPLNKLVGVQYRSDATGRSLEFEIRYLTRASVTATTTYTVVIPVPAAQDAQAQRVVTYFQGRK